VVRSRGPGPSRPRLALGVDIGGSGIKAAVVDVDSGEFASERARVKTPQPSTPIRCIAALLEVVATVTKGTSVGPDVPIGVGIPAVTIDGIVLTAANIDEDWLGFAAEDEIARATGRRTTIVNDADAAGIAEIRVGAGRDQHGTVLLLTLGTGIGSALFLDGHLVPNTELGHLEVRGKDAETRASAAARERRKLSWSKWAADLDDVLHRIDMLVWPDLIILGGGVSKDADRFIPLLTVRPPVVPAQLRNEAGIVGAAMLAAGVGGPRPRSHDLAPAAEAAATD
jgi:polyphosphate glucokinase